MKIYASKQLGNVYYMVKDPFVVANIVAQNVIRTSEKPERGYVDKKPHYYISLMRSLDKASRNPDKWIYGIRLDGNKLSDRYKIEPFSFAGHNFTKAKRHFVVYYISEYDDGTCYLQLTKRPVIQIPKYVYDDIKSTIIEDPLDMKDVKHLTVSTGKRSYRGKRIVEKYHYNVPSGGLPLNEQTVSQSTLSYLAKHTMLNETEERVWILNSDLQYINVSGCINGYIEPEGDDTIEQFIDAGLLPPKVISHYSNL